MPRKTRGTTNAKTVYTARELRREPTSAEVILWKALRGRRLNGLKFRRQHPFGPYVLDAFCVEHQLEVEVDGNIHLNPSQKEHDDIRAAFLQANEIRILRFKNEEIMNDLALVLEKIIRATHSPSPDDDVGHQERGLGGEA